MTAQKPGKPPRCIRALAARLVRLLLHVWPDRHRQRQQLRALEEHRLRDIGKNREDALREARKPFWR